MMLQYNLNTDRHANVNNQRAHIRPQKQWNTHNNGKTSAAIRPVMAHLMVEGGIPDILNTSEEIRLRTNSSDLLWFRSHD